jgi:hypothetical protein
MRADTSAEVTGRPPLPEPMRSRLVEVLAGMLVEVTRRKLDATPPAEPVAVAPAPRRRKGRYSERLRMNLKPSPKSRELPTLPAVDEERAVK